MLGGAAFQAASNTRGELIGGRVISGLGMGFINSTVPVLQNEVSPKASRGRFICASLSCLNFGIMTAYWVGYGFSYVTGSKAWRIPVALQAVFILVMMSLVYLVPESPRWLAAHGKADQALHVISRLQGKPEDHPDVIEQHIEILEGIKLESSVGSSSWKDLLREDSIKSRRRLLIACSVQFFQQAGGINALIFYMGNFLALVTDKASLLAGFVFVWFFVASFIPWTLIDTLGRRKLLLVCVTCMSMVFAIETGLVYAVQRHGSKAAGSAAVGFIFVFMGLFTVGFQAVVWVYPSEILPLRMRQKGSAISTACNWITNYIVVQIAPIGVANIGYRFYIIFCLLNASFVPVIYFFYPETKGLSLEAVDLLFTGSSSHVASDGEMRDDKGRTVQHEDKASSDDI